MFSNEWNFISLSYIAADRVVRVFVVCLLQGEKELQFSILLNSLTEYSIFITHDIRVEGFVAFLHKQKLSSSSFFEIACDFCLVFCILKARIEESSFSMTFQISLDKWTTAMRIETEFMRSKHDSTHTREPAREQLIELTTWLCWRRAEWLFIAAQDYTRHAAERDRLIWLRDFKDVFRLHNLQGTTN